MALHDMAKMTVSGTPGTGPITLGTAVPGFQTFTAAGATNAETFSYGVGDTGNVWEVGVATYTAIPPSITRAPTASSSGGAAVDLTSAAVVSIVALASDFPTGLDIGSLPAIDEVTLTGAELVVVEQASANTKWSLGALYRITVGYVDYIASNPLDAPISTNENGGNINFAAGDADGVGEGGTVRFDAGNGGSDGAGGNLIFSSGSAQGSNPGGEIEFTAGDSGSGATGNGGSLLFASGISSATDGDGGDITFEVRAGAGAGRAGQLFAKNIPTADPAVSQTVWNDHGVLTFSGSTSVISAQDPIDIPTLDGSELFLVEQTANNTKLALSSLFTVLFDLGTYLPTNPLDAAAASSFSGKPIILRAGSGDTSAGGGYVQISSGDGVGVGTGGSFELMSGWGGVNGSGGSFSLTAGSSGGGDNGGGGFFLLAGAASGAATGGLFGITGGAAPDTGGVGGDVLIAAGLGAASNGNVIVGDVPTVDPAVFQAIWNQSGVLMFSGATLAAAIAAADLSGLPTSDPGGGKPWLSSGFLKVGA